MKYGLLMHTPTTNIGDDIQSYAIKQFLPRVDYIIDREKAFYFKPEDEKPVAVIMAAWWMWAKWNWPPSKYILPYFTGFHYSDNKLADQAGCPVGYMFMEGLGKEYMQNYGPIGCRDIYTLNNFRELGIDSYFSGCISISLPKQKRIKPEKEYVCLVDVLPSVEKKIRKELEGTDIEIKTFKHYIKKEEQLKKTWQQRMDDMEELLTTYQNAKCVITRRLHAALPCLAMEVPTLLTIHTFESIRFSPYYDWLNCCLPEDYAEGRYEYDILNPPANPTNYLEPRKKLIESVKGFIDHAESLGDASTDEISKFSRSEKEIEKWRYRNIKKTDKIWRKELKGRLNEKEQAFDNKMKAQIRSKRGNKKEQNELYDKMFNEYLKQARRIFQIELKKRKKKDYRNI